MKIYITSARNLDEIYADVEQWLIDKRDAYYDEDETLMIGDEYVEASDYVDDYFYDEIYEIEDASDLETWFRNEGWTLDRGYGGEGYKERVADNTDFEAIWNYLEEVGSDNDKYNEEFDAILMTQTEVNDLIIFWDEGEDDEDDEEPISVEDGGIRLWYEENFPEDEAMAENIEPSATFQGLFEALDSYEDIYEYVGQDIDSIVRERVFQRLSEIMEVPYEQIYDQWLSAGSKDTTIEEATFKTSIEISDDEISMLLEDSNDFWAFVANNRPEGVTETSVELRALRTKDFNKLAEQYLEKYTLKQLLEVWANEDNKIFNDLKKLSGALRELIVESSEPLYQVEPYKGEYAIYSRISRTYDFFGTKEEMTAKAAELNKKYPPRGNEQPDHLAEAVSKKETIKAQIADLKDKISEIKKGHTKGSVSALQKKIKGLEEKLESLTEATAADKLVLVNVFKPFNEVELDNVASYSEANDFIIIRFKDGKTRVYTNYKVKSAKMQTESTEDQYLVFIHAKGKYMNYLVYNKDAKKFQINYAKDIVDAQTFSLEDAKTYVVFLAEKGVEAIIHDQQGQEVK